MEIKKYPVLVVCIAFVLLCASAGVASVTAWMGDEDGNVDIFQSQALGRLEANGTYSELNNSSYYMLTVSKIGSGNITSSPPGITCGDDCSELYEKGTYVNLTAIPDKGWASMGVTCDHITDEIQRQLCELYRLRQLPRESATTSFSTTVLIDQTKNVTFVFIPGSVLEVSKIGSGTVISSPGSIHCGSHPCYCRELYANTTNVTLSATPAIGAEFIGWGEDCSGTSNCTLNMSEHRKVTASFTHGGQYILIVNKSGSGTITSNPPGIDCGSDCSELYEDGTEVTLTATANSGWGVWSFTSTPHCPDCPPDEVEICNQLLELERLVGRPPPITHSCTITMDMTKTATITFIKTGSSVIYVPDDYAKIQWAVDNASAGDTIIVRDGTYYEKMNVTKRLIIKSENGSSNCVVDAEYSGSVFTLSADGIWLEGFTVRNASWYPYAGIKVASSNSNYIMNNNISNNGDSIYLYSSSNNKITKNNISNNQHGIYLDYSDNNNITDNNISNNYYNGIVLNSSNNNNITNNNVSGNEVYTGIILDSSSNNNITHNIISNNLHGILLYYSRNNFFFLNNFINIRNIICFDTSTNIWNSTEEITYTYKGNTYTNYLGNYWSDYTGNDTNGDGIGDTPYSIDSSDKDNYPLMEPWEKYFAPVGPTCKIELQKDGVKIDKIGVGEWFNIVITDYSGDIKKVRFLSDESQNGKVDEGFTWTDWYDWDTSKEDWTGNWYASNKTKTWAFATSGEKEVWAEVEDDVGQTARCFAGIEAVLDFKLPLPGGKSWLLTVQAKDGKTLWGKEPDKYHVNRNALDFDDITQEDGKLKNVLVLAAADGKVIDAGGSPDRTCQGKKALGYYVMIKHSNGLISIYLHLANPPLVNKGDSVTQGQQIGIVGNTGCSYGSHIHFDIQPSTATNFLIEGKPIDDYKVGTIKPYNPLYYPSTNTVIYR